MSTKFKSLSIALAIFLLEVLIATQFSGSRVIRGSLGDFFVVILLYFLAKPFCKIAPPRLALGVLWFAFAVEISQYFHLADLLGFARGGLISVLMGNTFSWMDMLMYLLGCGAAYWMDVHWLFKSRENG